MKEVASAFLVSFGILSLLALAGFNPIANFPVAKEAHQHRAEVQQMREQQTQK